ncbi:MAG TPA: thioesterase family protein [Bauldia sp.]|nr:thioesterase family protein [Bauldia sp.]
MKPSLKPGLTHRLTFRVPQNKTVPFLYPEAAEFRTMPQVLATGYMVGLFEWACIELMRPHLDRGEGSLGIHVDFSHVAATPAGLTVTVEAECTAVNGRKLSFHVRGHDGVDLIGEGEHERAVVVWDKFNARVADKVKAAMALSA